MTAFRHQTLFQPPSDYGFLWSMRAGADGKLYLTMDSGAMVQVIKRYHPTTKVEEHAWLLHGGDFGPMSMPDRLCCDANGTLHVLVNTGGLWQLGTAGPDDTVLTNVPTVCANAAWPSGIAFDGTDYFISDDSLHLIHRVRADGVYQGWYGKSTANGAGYHAEAWPSDPVSGGEDGAFSHPRDVSLVGGALYVLDSGNARVQKLALDGAHIWNAGSAGVDPGQLTAPESMTTGADGISFVVDAGWRVQAWDAHGNWLDGFGANSAVMAPPVPTGDEPTFAFPRYPAYDSATGILWVATHYYGVSVWQRDDTLTRLFILPQATVDAGTYLVEGAATAHAALNDYPDEPASARGPRLHDGAGSRVYRYPETAAALLVTSDGNSVPAGAVIAEVALRVAGGSLDESSLIGWKGVLQCGATTQQTTKTATVGTGLANAHYLVERYPLSPLTGQPWSVAEVNALVWGVIEGADWQASGLAVTDCCLEVLARISNHQPPTCSLTVDAVVQRAVTVTVQAQDGDGELVNVVITWGDDHTTVLDAGELATLRAGGSVQTSHVYPPEGGTFGVYATATEAGGASTDSDIMQAVVSPNCAPTASFTVQVDAGDHRTVTITTNASSDPDGSLAAWRFIPGNGAGWMDGTVGQPLVYTYPTHGEYTGRVAVTDDEGATDEQSAIITVENDAPEAAGSLVKSGCTVTLTDASTDSDGHIASAQVEWGDGSAPEAMTPGDSRAHAYLPLTQLLAVTLTVTDDDGATAQVVLPVTLVAWAPPILPAPDWRRAPGVRVSEAEWPV